MIKTDIIITPNDDEFLQIAKLTGEQDSVERILKNKRSRLDYIEAKEELVKLVEPKVCWNRFPVKKIEKNHVILEGDFIIGKGPVAKVVKGAEELVLGVCTIGMPVEDASREYMKNSKFMKGFILDSLASWAVDSVRTQFYEWIKKEIHMKEGFRTSSMLWPGNSWPIEEQAKIFSKLEHEAEEIGVKLSSSLMMIPQKSLTFLFGIGKNKLGKEDSVQCEFCPNKNDCKAYKIRVTLQKEKEKQE
ncbi:MAG: hypothetical protein GY870_00235 [archaeon]|nr:hypothetical protein [archaeon]